MFKFLCKFVVIAILTAGSFCFIGFLLSPRLSEVGDDFQPTPLETIKKNFEVEYDFDHPISFPRKVDYSLGPKAPWWPKGESPILKDLVEKGKLPPVAERVGSEPLVLKGVDGVGQYGGIWLRVGADNVRGRIGQICLTRWSPGGYPRVMNVARAIDHSKDWKTFTIHLRKGMKWSDGHPFTTDAVKYYLDCLDCSSGSYPQTLKDANGRNAEFTFIDDQTFKISYGTPKGDFYEKIGVCYTPGHYLRQYHYQLGDKAKIKEIMDAYELGSARTAYNFMRSRFNPELPTLYPWIYRSYSAVDPQTYVRNPYFWAVDTEGNQLPYIDAIQTKNVDIKMLPIRAAQGESSIQLRGLDFANFTELKEKSLQSGDFDVYLWYPAFTSYFLAFSLNRYVDPGKPETRWKAALLSDKRFRQAFSMAIDRKRIIKATFYGMGKPEQMKLFPPYDKHPIKDAYAQYDPEKASKVLDELGLGKRDSEGYRMFPDGTRCCFYINNPMGIGLGPSEFIVDDLKKIGLRVVSRIGGGARAFLTGDYDLISDWSGNSVNYRWRFRMGLPLRWAIHVNGGELVPREREAFYSGGAGKAMKLLRIIEQKSPQERIPCVNKLLDIIGEEVYTISIGSPLPMPVVVSKAIRNVPKVAVYDHSLEGIGCAGTETYYFARSNASPGLEQQLENSLIDPVLRPGSAHINASAGTKILNWIVKILIIGLIAAVLIILILKYPFALRRMFIMIPTLFIISIVCFIVIQLPPGDYLQMEMVRLHQEGENNEDAQARIAELKEMFHYGEPMWKSYLRWSGLYWFTTFDNKDTGLLQGNLGRSMATLRPINSMIAERLGFTLALALAGIILGYIISWPIGIICAVRKGGWFDYGFMFTGFLAMCIPSFIIGLILVVISGKSGLFSPEFASQPNWDWPKLYDFLGHIWIPIVIMLIGCVSGGGRIFRANILDELHKPYVVTARAKGVRPFKLIMKYPVRMAMNPWASSFGGIFPALIGGNAILAIVIGLPTLGPMMLGAVMDQDVYLACANLMMLSTLSVFGVLISDIMLIIVDPRIKYGKA